MMLSVNQVRLYSVQYTHNINPIMNDECYYTAEKGLVRLHIVYNTHTRLNPMLNVQYTVYKIQCVQYTHNTMMNATTQLVNFGVRGDLLLPHGWTVILLFLQTLFLSWPTRNQFKHISNGFFSEDMHKTTLIAKRKIYQYFWNCIFPKCIIWKCTFLKCISWKCIFGKLA